MLKSFKYDSPFQFLKNSFAYAFYAFGDRSEFEYELKVHGKSLRHLLSYYGISMILDRIIV